MIPLSTALRSSLGKKYLMAFTGLVWLGFATGHLIGNLLLLLGREPFNHYAEFLETFGHGAAVPLAEAFLVITLAIHVVNGLTVAWADKNRARPRGYAVTNNAGGRSQKTLASMSMAITGLLLLVFLVIHVATMKYGVMQPTEGLGFVPNPDPGLVPAKDLYARVVRSFSNPLFVGFYTLIMVMLGTHLSHGVWSAFQSLGLNNHRLMRFLRPFAYAYATLLALGFLILPVSIYLLNDRFATLKGGLFG